ncbi:MAG: hypothetical protein NT007_11635 [Candidatus Kapabacteria bacterium]|nr:hypothetical protein [Candidatus Kapabacteria bacterium]
MRTRFKIFEKETNYLVSSSTVDYTELLNHFIQAKKSYKNESTYQIWHEGFHHELMSEMIVLKKKDEYIYNNPVKRDMLPDPKIGFIREQPIIF